MGNHCVCRIQNRLRRTIVLFQPNGTAATVLLFKVQNILDGRAAETVDALVVVTDNTYIFISTRQQRSQQILHMVGILILVHQHISELPLIV